MMKVTQKQALSLLHKGFDAGLSGYPVLFSENGLLTIVEERLTGRLIVWEFDPDGSVSAREYAKGEV
jgi:hypothetical protein